MSGLQNSSLTISLSEEASQKLKLYSLRVGCTTARYDRNLFSQTLHMSSVQKCAFEPSNAEKMKKGFRSRRAPMYDFWNTF